MATDFVRLGFVLGLLALCATSTVSAVLGRRRSHLSFALLAALAFCGFELLRDPTLHDRIAFRAGDRRGAVAIASLEPAPGPTVSCGPEEGCRVGAGPTAEKGVRIKLAPGQGREGIQVDSGDVEVLVLDRRQRAKRCRGVFPLLPGEELRVDGLELRYLRSSARTGLPVAGLFDIPHVFMGSLTAAAVFTAGCFLLRALLIRRGFLYRGGDGVLAGALGLVLVSLLLLYRTSLVFQEQDFYLKQLAATALGLAGAFSVASCWAQLRSWLTSLEPTALFFVLVLSGSLALSGLVGPAHLHKSVAPAGSSFWVKLLFMWKEIAGVFVVPYLSLALLWAWRRGNAAHAAVWALAFFGPATYLLLKQDDLGPILLLGFVCGVAVLLATGRLWTVAPTAIAIALVWALAAPLAADRGPRLAVWLQPRSAFAAEAIWKVVKRSRAVESSPARVSMGEQQALALWGIRAGGLLGMGLGSGLSELSWRGMSNAVNDLALALAASELGFACVVGIMAVVVLGIGVAPLVSFVFRSPEAPSMTSDEPKGLVAAWALGVATEEKVLDTLAGLVASLLITSRALLNAVGVSGHQPFTGTFFPFLSAGGASLLATFLLLGVVLATMSPRESGSEVRPW